MGMGGRGTGARALAVALVAAAGAMIVPTSPARADHCIGRAPFREVVRQADLVVVARVEEMPVVGEPTLVRPLYRYRGDVAELRSPPRLEPDGRIRFSFGCGIPDEPVEIGDRIVAAYWVEWYNDGMAYGWLVDPGGRIKASSVQMSDPPRTFAQLDARLRSALAPDTATAQDALATRSPAGRPPTELLGALFLVVGLVFLRRFRVS